MMSNESISLFAGPSISRRGPSAFLVSLMIHGAAVGSVSYGILYNPMIFDRVVTERYTVRHLDLLTTEPEYEQSGEDHIPYPGPNAGLQIRGGTEDFLTHAAALQPMLSGAAGRQTLLQPGFNSHLKLAVEAPIPTIVIWTPELAATKEIVPPVPDKETAANVHPSVASPNEEMKLGDYAITSSNVAPRTETLPSGSTSPVVLHSTELLQLAPATISKSAELPTPTAVLSISDIRMPEGSITLPPVNETKVSAATVAPSEGQSKVAPPALKHVVNESLSAVGHGQSAAAPGVKPQLHAVAGKPSDMKLAALHQEDPGPASADDGTVHITAPKDGRFGVVVVGTSLADQYPETLEVWNDRVAYTAYLHVGLTKNWILQYSLIRTAETASGGTVARLEAPWPYDIVRPNLVSRDLNADALLVHGFLNEVGRFESLAVAFPAVYRRASFVIHALQQWQFRPARQNGKATPVEVLLIIPDEIE